ncbi:MAG TPA: hypothetical protein VMF06_14650 [Candidatus Limnocylindria bacterium]|nr:hypothetical protein [Candidatus Limnocylindria bacterium]
MLADSLKPKYWKPGYDTWHLLLLPALVAVLVSLAVLQPSSPPLGLEASRPRVPRFETVIDQPQPAAVLRADQLGEVLGRAEPGSRVTLTYRTVTTTEKVLSESVVDVSGRYSFRLQGFPVGSYGIRVAATMPDGQVSRTVEVPFRVVSPPAPPVKQAPKKKRTTGH